MAYYDVIRNLSPEQSRILKRDLARPSNVARMLGTEICRVPYDVAAYPLHEKIVDLLIEKRFIDRRVPLERLHEFLRPEDMALDFHELSNVTKAFYETGAGFLELYRRLIKEVLAELTLSAPLYYQATPTIRFMFPIRSEYDRGLHLHSDIMLGHPPQEINIWLPLTDNPGPHNFGLAPLAESLELYKEYDFDLTRFADARDRDKVLYERCYALTEPVTARLGEMIVFDSRCLHGTIEPRTDLTRISIDFRVILVDEYERMDIVYRGIGRRKMLFAPGHYFAESSTAA